MGKLVPIDAATKAKAREMYMLHRHMNDISAELKVSTATLSKWRAEEGWALERTAADEGFLDDIVQGRKIRLAKLAEMSVDQLERGILHLKGRHEPLTIPEMEKLSLVLMNLDRISRLDSNKSTENVAVKLDVQGQLTVERIREIITNDVFSGPDGEPTPGSST